MWNIVHMSDGRNYLVDVTNCDSGFDLFMVGVTGSVSTNYKQYQGIYYVYDPELGDPDSGITPGTAFEDIPEDWICPVCGLGKDMFEKVEE